MKLALVLLACFLISQISADVSVIVSAGVTLNSKQC